MGNIGTKNYYHILGVSSAATDAQIKARYRLLSKRYHPDMGGSQAAMASLNEAYGILSDTFRRSIYDAELRRSLKVPARTPERPLYAPARKRPTTSTEPPFARRTQHKQKVNWWSRFAWGFAIIVLAAGALSQLPLARALPANTTSQTPATSPPLQVSYQPDATSGPSESTSTPYTPDKTSRSAPPASPLPATTPSTEPADTCDAGNANDPCRQPRKNCTTTSFGLYKHIVCNTPSLSNDCTNDTANARQYAACY